MTMQTKLLLRWTEPFSDGEIYGMSGTTPFFTIAESKGGFLLTSQLLESSISQGDDLEALKQTAEDRFKVVLKDSGLAPVKSLMKANVAELAKEFMWDAYSVYFHLGDYEGKQGIQSFKDGYQAVIEANELEGDALKYFKLRVKGILEIFETQYHQIELERDYHRLLSKHMRDHFDYCEREWLK